MSERYAERYTDPLTTFGDGPRYDQALASTILIVALHLDPALPEAVRFGRILFEVLDCLYRAEENLRRLQPSEN